MAEKLRPDPTLQRRAEVEGPGGTTRESLQERAVSHAHRALAVARARLEEVPDRELRETQRRPCVPCRETGVYRRLETDATSASTVQRYVCAHGHWLYLVKPTTRDFPPAVRRVNLGLLYVDE
jgi:hypothetical protein